MATVTGTQYDDVIKTTGSTYFRNGKKAGTFAGSTDDPDSISAGNGNDSIEAGTGNDTIAGGNGNDTIYGQAGNDVIWGDSFGNSDGNDNGQDKLYGGDGDDLIHGGNAKDEIYGDAGKDTLYGDNGGDIIKGGAGTDIINGGNGGDVLYGEGDADTFIYTTNTSLAVSDSPYSAGAAADPNAQWTKPWDVIVDFQSGADKIDLSNLPLPGAGASPLVWRGAQGTDADAGTVRPALAHGVWTDNDGNFLYADINGDGKADLKIQVSGVGLDDLLGVQENDAPEFTSGDSASVPENTPAVDVVYDASATDQEGDTITYSLSGDDAALFSINSSTGEVKFNSSPNFEAPADSGADNVYNITVVASDGFVSTNKAVSITVTDVNEAPTITSGASGSEAENTAISNVVYDANASDPDAGDTLTYSLSGADAGLFDINGTNGEVTFKVSPNFEAPGDANSDNVYEFTVTATDTGALSDSKAVSITVTDVVENAAPVATDDKWFISDNTAATLAATTALLGNDSDPDGDSIKITALSNDGTTWLTDASDGTADNVIHLDTAKGLLAVNVLTGVITYTTDSSPTTADVTDTFYYQISDDDVSPLTDVGMVTVTIKDIVSGNKTDTIDLSAQTYQVSYISSDNGDDSLTGGGGTDTFYGGPGVDTLKGGSGNDLIYGDAGDDAITGNGGNDTIDGGPNNDTIYYASTGDGNDVITGFDANPGGGQDIINLDGLFDTYGVMSGTRADHVKVVAAGSDTLVLIDTNNSYSTGDNSTYEMTITIVGVTSTDITVGADVLVGS